MAITIDPMTHIIDVPKADLTVVSVTPEVYEIDLDWFRLQLKDLEDNQAYNICMLKTHTHNTEVTLAGLTYSRIVEILPPYTVEFEDGQYTVNCIGANHNLSDVKVANQVSLIVNNAAGLISSKDIEFASFRSGAWLDTVDGDDSYKGNEEFPVKTVSRAVTVAVYRGFKKIYAVNDVAITGSHDLDGFTIKGHSHVDTDVSLDPTVACENLTIEECSISGTLDGGTVIRNCVVSDLVFFNGDILDSGLTGTITLGGGLKAVIDNCKTIDQDNPPTINMGGTGQSLAMPNYTGILTVNNLSDADQEIGIGLKAGSVTLANTISAGTIVVSGTGVLTDQSTGTAVVIDDGLMNKANIADSVWEAAEGEIVKKMVYNKVIMSGDIATIYEDDEITVWKTFDLANEGRVAV